MRFGQSYVEGILKEWLNSSKTLFNRFEKYNHVTISRVHFNWGHIVQCESMKRRVCLFVSHSCSMNWRRLLYREHYHHEDECREKLYNHWMTILFLMRRKHNGNRTGYILKSPGGGSERCRNSDVSYVRERKGSNHVELCATAAKAHRERFLLFVSRDAIKEQRIWFNVHPDNMLSAHKSRADSVKCLLRVWVLRVTEWRHSLKTKQNRSNDGKK